ncbi:MAG: hypothetical protein HY047_13640 [Acidobacteria bacterium]|nr:hypothetical protein [Acidobacteriota bacterium]
MNRLLEQDRTEYAAHLEKVKNNYQQDVERLKADIERTQQRLQAHLDRSTYVHRVQFEKEFTALSDIWKAVADLRSVLEGLSWRDRDHEDDMQYEKRINELILPRFGRFVEVVDNQSPFYQQDIYRELSDAVTAVRTEITLARTENPKDTPDYYKQRRVARGDFETRAKKISDLIRVRLASLVVVEREQTERQTHDPR